MTPFQRACATIKARAATCDEYILPPGRALQTFDACGSKWEVRFSISSFDHESPFSLSIRRDGSYVEPIDYFLLEEEACAEIRFAITTFRQWADTADAGGQSPDSYDLGLDPRD